MNTTKVGTQRVNTMSTQKAKNSFQNFYYLFAYLYAIVMMGVILGCLFINDNHYCGFHKRAADGISVTTSFPGWAIFLVILACISFCFAFSIFILRRFRPVETKCTYLVRDCLITNIVLFYFIMLGCCSHDGWLWSQFNSEHISTGGINFIIWSMAFVLYLICSQINYYKGDQIKAWFRKNPFNK